MLDDAAGLYTVVIACQPARSLHLTGGQARGTACIRCTAADAADTATFAALRPVSYSAGVFAGAAVWEAVNAGVGQ
jgi:hypothetical protein